MTLVEALPKNDEGQIALDPGGIVDGEPSPGGVDVQWFEINFPELAQASCPINNDQLLILQSIDSFWAENAVRWRADGII